MVFLIGMRDSCYGTISPFLCGRKGVSFGWLRDSVSEHPLRGRVNPVGDDGSPHGEERAVGV